MQSGKAHSWYQAQANWSLANLLFKTFYCFRLFHFYCFLYELLFWVMYGVIFRCNVFCTLGFPPFFLFTLRNRENSSLDQCVCFWSCSCSRLLHTIWMFVFTRLSVVFVFSLFLFITFVVQFLLPPILIYLKNSLSLEFYLMHSTLCSLTVWMTFQESAL